MNLTEKILTLLADGCPRTAVGITKSIYEPPESYFKQDSVKQHLDRLCVEGSLHRKMVHRHYVYVRSEAA